MDGVGGVHRRRACFQALRLRGLVPRPDERRRVGRLRILAPGAGTPLPRARAEDSAPRAAGWRGALLPGLHGPLGGVARGERPDRMRDDLRAGSRLAPGAGGPRRAVRVGRLELLPLLLRDGPDRPRGDAVPPPALRRHVPHVRLHREAEDDREAVRHACEGGRLPSCPPAVPERAGRASGLPLHRRAAAHVRHALARPSPARVRVRGRSRGGPHARVAACEDARGGARRPRDDAELPRPLLRVCGPV